MTIDFIAYAVYAALVLVLLWRLALASDRAERAEAEVAALRGRAARDAASRGVAS